MQSVPLCGQMELSWERKFIDFPVEKDRMYRVLGRIRRLQAGTWFCTGRKAEWAYAKRLNTELGRKIAGAVAGYAEENHADVIVFEYMETKEEYPEKETEAASVEKKGYPDKM